MGYGGLLDSTLASAATRKVIFPGPGAVVDKPSITGSVDSRWQLFLVAEGTIASLDMLSPCGATGPNMCLRLHA
jgi:hypothetical protein